MTDNEIIKAFEICYCDGEERCENCPYKDEDGFCIDVHQGDGNLLKEVLDLINRQKAEINGLIAGQETLQKCISEKMTEIEKLQNVEKASDNYIKSLENCINHRTEQLKTAKSEAIKEFDEKITEVFMRYAHLHSYAEGARKDYIETVAGKEIEMQSVWDVITLQKNGMAEYEEMGRLQKNIETIEKERLLTELEKDFRLLVKEMMEGK